MLQLLKASQNAPASTPQSNTLLGMVHSEVAALQAVQVEQVDR